MTRIRLAALAMLCSAPLAWAQENAAAPQLDAALAESLTRAQAVVERDPSRPEHLYNLGVLQYRAGQLTEAGESFRGAAERLNNALAARSTYNRGTTRYREALESLQTAPQAGATPTLPNAGPEGAPDPQAQAIAALEESLQQLKDSIRANPTSSENVDARANAELAHRLLKKLKEQQKQEQQQQQQQEQQQDEKSEEQESKESKDAQDSPKQDGKSSDEKPKDSSQEQPGKSDQPSQDANKQPSEESSKPEVEEKKERSEPKPDGKPEANQEQSEPNEPKDASQAQGKDAPPREGMSKQEIEQLLQKIRDREQIRRAQKLAAQQKRTTPARKDW